MPYYWEREGVTLRPTHPSDWVYFYENYFDSETRFYFYTECEPPTDREDARRRFAAFLRSAKKKDRLDLTVMAEGKVVGSLNLYDIDRRAGTFQIASFICEGARGRGYGQRAVSMLLEYAFFELRLHKYNARIVQGNEPSIRLHRLLGCRREGVLRDMLYHGGEHKNIEWWGMTAQEYADTRPISERTKEQSIYE